MLFNIDFQDGIYLLRKDIFLYKLNPVTTGLVQQPVQIVACFAHTI